MKTTNLLDFFDRINYDWKKDLEDLRTICMFTKTRVNESKTSGEMSYGSEQCFLVKAVANNLKADAFFEIGTGRGTACYSVALEEAIENIVTVDIVSHYQKKNEAIGYRPAVVSNEDIFGMIPGKNKSKISFKHRSEVPFILNDLEGEFDLAFIDGDHTNVDTIKEDFEICNKLVRPGGIILFDDYHPSKFAVKEVVDQILTENPSLEAELVCFHGHLFDEDRKALDSGIVIVKK